MKWLIPTIVVFATFMFASDAIAQCRTVRYAAPVTVARPVYAAPVTTYYAAPAVPCPFQ